MSPIAAVPWLMLPTDEEAPRSRSPEELEEEALREERELQAQREQEQQVHLEQLRHVHDKIRSEHQMNAALIFKELEEGGASKTKEARLLRLLAAQESALLERMIALQDQLVARGLLVAHEPKFALQFITAAKGLASLHVATAERVESLLASAAAHQTLDAPRRPVRLDRVA